MWIAAVCANVERMARTEIVLGGQAFVALCEFDPAAQHNVAELHGVVSALLDHSRLETDKNSSESLTNCGFACVCQRLDRQGVMLQ